MTKKLLTAGLLILAAASLGCGGRSVTRVDPGTTIDLSGRWNDVDSREVATAMIQNCLNSPWLTRHQTDIGSSDRPVVIVGVIRNKSMEHIPVDTFIKDIERVIRLLAGRGDMAIVLVEQYFDFARRLAQQYAVMDRGEIVLAGAADVMDEARVRRHLTV